jgi:ring-1,2-phenylacetyl-CoA epoxidase subunit PaaE
MNTVPRFHSLKVLRLRSEGLNGRAITLEVPPDLRQTFSFKAGQYLVVRADIAGVSTRRSYSVCSTPEHLRATGEIDIGVRSVAGGVFSVWANTQLQVGESLEAMPPEGRFVSTQPLAHNTVCFAAGSGITPILSLIATGLASNDHSRYTLVYGNQRMQSVMFNESLQDLKDRYPQRLSLMHVLSRQEQDIPLLQGRIDEDKVTHLISSLLPATNIDEVFVCGPDAMMQATVQGLLRAGVSEERIHSEHFGQASTPSVTPSQHPTVSASDIDLHIICNGKRHSVPMSDTNNPLSAGLEMGLDLPYSCRNGVCCTCRAKVMEGQVHMQKNFTLTSEEIAQGFVLSCQARALTPKLVLSFDER